MSKKLIFIIAGAVIIAGGLWFWAQKDQKSTDNKPINRDAQLILFYGAECPHCKELEKFIADNGIRSQVNFEELEVYHNKDNSNFLLEKTKECGIDEKSIGVPFFYARGKCLEGVPEIEDFLKKQE
jgi:hypothetical protein